jgi:hypothetical protein
MGYLCQPVIPHHPPASLFEVIHHQLKDLTRSILFTFTCDSGGIVDGWQKRRVRHLVCRLK